ncbi:protein shisa-5-like [Haliotis rubra]|uniref:protein shisa-5-like n=1 Tax=Haliotis rubra TaxID=36100 RepID=UPI001EE55259|nr:protein shisa-5-like [Haliotis rubra]
MLLLKGPWIAVPWITVSYASKLCYRWGYKALYCPDICCGTIDNRHCCGNGSDGGSSITSTSYSWVAAVGLITLMVLIRCCYCLRSRKQRHNENNPSLRPSVISTGSLPPPPALNRSHAYPDQPPAYYPGMAQPPPSYAEVMAGTAYPPTAESSCQPAPRTCPPQTDSLCTA